MEEIKNDIKLLKFPDNVRLRPGMYIGSTENPNVILREIIDNSIDELMLPNGTDEVKIEVDPESGYCIVGDNGRGIPVDIDEETGLTKLELAMSNLHAGGKFGKGKYASIGLNGVGSSCLTGDTQVPIRLNGSLKSVRLDSIVGTNQKLNCYSDGIVPTDSVNIWKTKDTVELVQIETESGGVIKCTPDHLILLSDGTYKKAEDIVEGDDLMYRPIYSFTLSEVFNGEAEVNGPLVYRIYRKSDGKSYIGSTIKSLKGRFIGKNRARTSHFDRLNSGLKSKLYNDIRSLGIDEFMVDILYINPEADKCSIEFTESYFVSFYGSYINGYNMTHTGKGHYPTPDHNEQSRRGKLGAESNRSNGTNVFFDQRLHSMCIDAQRESKTGLFNPEMRSMVGSAGLTVQMARCVDAFSRYLLDRDLDICEFNWNNRKYRLDAIPYNLKNKLPRWKIAQDRYSNEINNVILEYKNRNESK